mgnify:CR=1 FL=1
MCNCNISKDEINESIFELVHNQWLLENGFLLGDYIFYWCDFCSQSQLEYISGSFTSTEAHPNLFKVMMYISGSFTSTEAHPNLFRVRMYPKARICPKCQKTICNKCDLVGNLIYPNTEEMEYEYDYYLWWLRYLYHELN